MTGVPNHNLHVELVEKLRRNRKRRLLRITAAIVLALTAAVGWTAWGIWSFDTTTDHDADAAIILGATTRNGKPSPIFSERVNQGISLYKAQRVTHLIFTGSKLGGEPVSLAEAAREYAIARGVPAGDILTEPYSRITKEYLAHAREIAESEGLTTFLIVSDPLHMKRSMRMARDLDMIAWPSPTPTTRFTSMKGRLWFLRRETYFYIQYALVTRFIRPPTLAQAMQRESAFSGSLQSVGRFAPKD